MLNRKWQQLRLSKETAGCEPVIPSLIFTGIYYSGNPCSALVCHSREGGNLCSALVCHSREGGNLYPALVCHSRPHLLGDILRRESIPRASLQSRPHLLGDILQWESTACLSLSFPRRRESIFSSCDIRTTKTCYQMICTKASPQNPVCIILFGIGRLMMLKEMLP